MTTFAESQMPGSRARRGRFGGDVSRGADRRLALLLLLSLFLGSFAAHAQGDLAASAALSRATTGVGEPVQLRVQVTGTKRAGRPPEVEVEGLDIQYIRAQTQVQMHNFDLSMSVTHIYQIMPRRAGVFEIPALRVEAEGRWLDTEPVTLTVQNGGGGSGGGGQRADRLSWAEIVVPKDSAYVGETLPVELRLYVDARIRWNIEMMPDLAGEGFTKTKMPEPRQEQARKDGRDYDVAVFRTAITPGKAGKISIGPGELQFVAQIPRARPNRPRSLLDEFFGEDAFNEPFGMFGAVEQRRAIAEAVELEVKPLPAAGRPAGFSGAVGQFSLAVEGNPDTVKIGDPITMKVTVGGKGNFDRVTAPPLVDPKGWRTYPPSANFQPEDDMGVRGAKTFEIAVIPEEKKTEMPAFAFSYFDPATEKYATLKSSPAPLTVEGQAPPAPPPVPKANPAAAAKADAAPKAAPAPSSPTDILGIRYDFGAQAAARPLYRRQAFWLAQLVPLAILLGLLSRRRRKPDASAQQRAAWRRERSAQMAEARRQRDRTAFYEAAARVLQLDTALATGRSPDSVDAATVCAQRDAEGEETAVIQEVFEARAEVLYAGGGGGNARLHDTERMRVLSILEQ